MTLDLIRIGLDQPADYRMGMITILRRTARLLLGDPGAIVLGQSQPILTVGDLPTDVAGEPSERPGGPTWFGPGVLLIAPAVLAVADVLHEALLDTGIELCASYGVTAARRPHFPGLWVENRKIASIGLGGQGLVVGGGGGLALLVNPDLAVFDTFDACGIPGIRMTSLAAEAGHPITVAEVADRLTPILTRIIEPLLLAPAGAVG